jgi:uncharacterized protein YlxW (UPF0749 family)
MSATEVTKPVKPAHSEFKQYLMANPQFSEELVKILVKLYNHPLKQSQTQDYLKKMMNIEKVDPNKAAQLRAENEKLRNEIYDLNDELIVLEKELEDIKEEEEL